MTQQEVKKYYAKENYILREIAGESVLVSIGDNIANFCGIINLNSSAKELWKAMKNGATEEELVKVLTENFDVSEEMSKEDIKETLNLLYRKVRIPRSIFKIMYLTPLG